MVLGARPLRRSGAVRILHVTVLFGGPCAASPVSLLFGGGAGSFSFGFAAGASVYLGIHPGDGPSLPSAAGRPCRFYARHGRGLSPHDIHQRGGKSGYSRLALQGDIHHDAWGRSTCTFQGGFCSRRLLRTSTSFVRAGSLGRQSCTWLSVQLATLSWSISSIRLGL